MPGERRGGWKPPPKPEGEDLSGDTMRDVRRIENERGLDEQVAGVANLPDERTDLDATMRRPLEAFEPKSEPEALDDTEQTMRMPSPFAPAEAPRPETKDEGKEKAMMKHILEVGGHDFRSAEYQTAIAVVKAHQAECERLVRTEVFLLNRLIELLEADEVDIEYLKRQNNPRFHAPTVGFDGQYSRLCGLYQSAVLFGESTDRSAIPVANIRRIRDTLMAAQQNMNIEKSAFSKLMRRIRG